ncbi:keratin, type II cytoskeletal cochleal-like [Amblyraja radiata]|uniref:keratin, type II cytoskeletal cochleal-like n=1 Tax=Amblyraja radiata TaxID=386614 RepID=UPI001402B5B5|nr:keratin, type II cytoskeletal cochleal-like [Amblyraja radiata]
MRGVIEDVKLQHADIAARNKAEAEYWYQNMSRDLEQDRSRQNDELRNSKTEEADLIRQLQRLKAEIDNCQNQRSSLEATVVEADERGQMMIKEGKVHVEELQGAIRKVKTDLVDQAREHQELLNATMALDMEIATYRKLMDGEDERDGVPNSGTVRVIQSTSKHNRPTTLNY